MRVRSVPVPPSAMAERTLSRIDFADAYRASLPPGASQDPRVWVERVFHSPPAWVKAALRARNAVVARVGLKTPRLAATGFPELDRDEREVLLGLDDRHLDFRVSVLVEGGTLTVATRVRLNSALGRAYFAPVRLVHPFVVRAMVARALAQSAAP